MSQTSTAFDWIGRWSALIPEKEAIVELATGRSFTYRQFNERANQLANGWRSRWGIKKGDRVGIFAKNCAAYLEALFAAAKLGAILVPVNYRLAREEIVYILNDSLPDGLMIAEEYVDVVSQAKDKLSISHYLLIDGTTDGMEIYEDFLTSSNNIVPSLEESNVWDDPLLILYTSGTTGLPKGSVLTHGHLYFNAANEILNGQITFHTRTLAAAPFFHTAGLNVFTTPAVYAGATNIIMSTFDPGEVLKLVESKEIDALFLVTTMWRMLLLHPDFEKTDFSSVKTTGVGGEPLPLSVTEELYHTKGIALRQGFGMTEAGPCVTVQRLEETWTKRGSVGKPAFSMGTRIVDDKGDDMPVGEVGELLLRGPTVISEYWNNPEATAATFKDGWFCTGDLANRDQDGFYYIRGRKKEMIISGGENVYPAEVERVISQHPKVAEVAVIGKPDPKWGEVCHAVVCPRSGQAVTENELLEYLQDKLSRYKIPKAFSFMETLPKAGTGKVMKRTLEEMFSIKP